MTTYPTAKRYGMCDGKKTLSVLEYPRVHGAKVYPKKNTNYVHDRPLLMGNI